MSRQWWKKVLVLRKDSYLKGAEFSFFLSKTFSYQILTVTFWNSIYVTTLTQVAPIYVTEQMCLCWFCFIFVASQICFVFLLCVCFFCHRFRQMQYKSRSLSSPRAASWLLEKGIYFQFIIRTNRVGRANIISRGKQNNKYNSFLWVQTLFVTQNMQTQMTVQWRIVSEVVVLVFSQVFAFCLFVDNNKLECMNSTHCFFLFLTKKCRIFL